MQNPKLKTLKSLVIAATDSSEEKRLYTITIFYKNLQSAGLHLSTKLKRTDPLVVVATTILVPLGHPSASDPNSPSCPEDHVTPNRCPEEHVTPNRELLIPVAEHEGDSSDLSEEEAEERRQAAGDTHRHTHTHSHKRHVIPQ